MIQRKQTLFLLLAVVLSVVTLSTQIASLTTDGMTVGRVYNLLHTDMMGASHFEVWPLFVILLFAASVSLYTIFIYMRRMRQAMLCNIAVMAYIAWYIALIVFSKTLAPDALNFHLSWTSVLPGVSAILCFMARKSIIADEKMVKAADRIR